MSDDIYLIMNMLLDVENYQLFITETAEQLIPVHITLQEHNQIIPISIALNLFVNLMIYVSPDLNAHIRLIGRKIASYVVTSAVSNITDIIYQWSNTWLLEINTAKSLVMLISKKRIPTNKPVIQYGNTTLKYVNSHKHLGVTINSKFTWENHIDDICLRASKRIHMITALRHKLTRNVLEHIYMSYVRPLLEYGDVLYDNSTNICLKRLEETQLTAARIVSGAKRYTSHALLYDELGWDRLEIRRQLHKLALFHQIVHKQAPEYLIELIPPPIHTRQTRQTDTNKLRPCRCKHEFYKQSFIPSAIDMWNNIPNDQLRHIYNKSSFKRAICTYISKSNTYPLKTFGKRHTQIIISQIRMHFSDLNEHLFNKNCIDSSMCRCEKGPESADHYFLSCEIYELHRENMFNSISSIYDLSQITLNILLFGDIDCNFEINHQILNATHRYIENTNRFK